MEERVNDNGSLSSRITQLECERDELRKDIEQLCLQQAGPSYLVVATRMHFQRTAGLEQEIEDLKKKLSGCIRDNRNLQEELSEVYHIKSQLADLHSAEVSKNMEAEKQIQFFQGCVAAAFSERDHSLMEAEKAKEQEELMSHKLNDFQDRVEKLTSDFTEEKKFKADLQIELMKTKERNETFEKVIDKFYAIRQGAVGCFGDGNSEDKCACLLHDPDEMWSFDEQNESSTSKHVASLQEELGMLRNSVGYLQNKLRVGMQIEKHLKEKFCALEEKHILSDGIIRKSVSMLRHFHTQLRSEVIKLVEEEKIHTRIILDEVQERMRQLHLNRMQNTEFVHRDSDCGDIECKDVHITSDLDASVITEIKGVAAPRTDVDGMGYTSDVVAQALQEKVDALLLLSQQEERHLLERDVNAILQDKMQELQRNLFQVTNEKVKALLELAQLRQDYQLLQESINHGMKNRKVLVGDNDKGNTPRELDGKLKNLLKRANLKHWIGGFDSNVNDANILMNNEESSSASKKFNYSVEFARLKVENATLQESMSSMEHLNSSVHRLRFSLLKAKDAAALPDPRNRTTEVLDNIILEAKLMKIALGSSLPVSWSAEADSASINRNFEQPTNPWIRTDSGSERVDPVSSAGFEMVELLILAAELQKERVIDKSSRMVDD